MFIVIVAAFCALCLVAGIHAVMTGHTNPPSHISKIFH